MGMDTDPVTGVLSGLSFGIQQVEPGVLHLLHLQGDQTHSHMGVVQACRGFLLSSPGFLREELARPVRFTTDVFPLASTLFFCSWNAAVDAAVELWRMRIASAAGPFPVLAGRAPPRFADVLDERLMSLFAAHLRSLPSSAPAVAATRGELAAVAVEIRRVETCLRRYNHLAEWQRLSESKCCLLVHHEQLQSAISEFTLATKELLRYATARKPAPGCAGNFLRLEPGWGWHHLYCAIRRETRRMSSKLPLYSKRQYILRNIRENQVIVLIGETGSGKSTQLVQYLADAGFANSDRSIVCTQPRKVAVSALGQRVAEESRGCSNDSIVAYATTLASMRKFRKILFVTDSVLLQLCLSSPDFDQFSCVIVDEVHERTLNTDLILALLKRNLPRRPDLKLVIMSATANAGLLSAYFGGCPILRVNGRGFPIEIKYEKESSANTKIDPHPEIGDYVWKVVNKVALIDASNVEGNILAFLTSPVEVEWACRQRFKPSTMVLPLHGKLQQREQELVFEKAPQGKRKIVFCTNIAETSLTIPDVKHVVDCGFSKERRFNPKTGISILQVCEIDKSSAMQRAGRAGRTQNGICYRLYNEEEFDCMALTKLPEIRRVHLGVAVLKLLSLGVQDFESFDFIEAPEPDAFSLALKNLKELGSVVGTQGNYELTPLGWKLVKLGIDPRIGRIVIESAACSLCKEGLVIAALLTCSAGNIFFRSGTNEEKARSDRLKMRFCNQHGDLLTLLSVYQEWDMLPERDRNKWCFENSVNAKSLRRCEDCVGELEWCLKHELNIADLLTRWSWSPTSVSEHSMKLRRIILSALGANLAVFSGHDRIGYDIISTGKQAYLHPSSALLMFGAMPTWVVFAEVLSTGREYITLATVIEREWIHQLCPYVSFNTMDLEELRMRKKVIPNLSSHLLYRLCGKNNKYLKPLVEVIKQCSDDRCIIEPDHEQNEIQIFTTWRLKLRAEGRVQKLIELERRWMRNECVERPLFLADNAPTMLFGPGAEVKQLLLGAGEHISVKVSILQNHDPDDKALLRLCDDESTGGLVQFQRNMNLADCKDGYVKWGVVTYGSVEGARRAVELLNGRELSKKPIRVEPLVTSSFRDTQRFLRLPSVKASLAWPRRQKREIAIVLCETEVDVEKMLNQFYQVSIHGFPVSCRISREDRKKVVLKLKRGGEDHVSEEEIVRAVKDSIGVCLHDVFIPRLPVCQQPSESECRAALAKEIAQFVLPGKFQVEVFEPRPKDFMTRAEISFEESEGKGVERAMDHLEGFSLPCCFPWQKISCKRTFSSHVQFSARVHHVLANELDSAVRSLRDLMKGVRLVVLSGGSGSCRVKIVGDSLTLVARCRATLEKLVEGMPVVHEKLDGSLINFLLAKEGRQILWPIESETCTYIAVDRRNNTVKIYGSAPAKESALEKFISKLSLLHEMNNLIKVFLRADGRPHGLMRELVKRYGADLNDLKSNFPETSIELDHRRQILCVKGSSEQTAEVVKNVEDLALSLHVKKDCESERNQEDQKEAKGCHICFCNIEDKYSLEDCRHSFCRACLIDQVNVTIKHRDGFPLSCTVQSCKKPFLLADLEALLSVEVMEELQRVSLSFYISSSRGRYRVCSTPDCPGMYAVSDNGALFLCPACSTQLCTTCHIEYHEGLPCEVYRQYKADPDASMQAWREGKQDVKNCKSCGYVIEKVDGCNHIICKCSQHICWICLDTFRKSEDCYAHLQDVHGGFT